MDKRRHPLSLDLLRGFRAAARHLSFTRAAQELFVTQSAISREIKTLEEQIGKPLFRRVHRALELTRAGEELYRATDEALGLLDAVTTRLAESGKTLAVTTTTALASLWLAPRLPRFNRLHPGIDVRIAASNDKPDLERDQMDIAIRFVPVGADTPTASRWARGLTLRTIFEKGSCALLLGPTRWRSWVAFSSSSGATSPRAMPSRRLLRGCTARYAGMAS